MARTLLRALTPLLVIHAQECSLSGAVGVTEHHLEWVRVTFSVRLKDLILPHNINKEYLQFSYNCASGMYVHH